MSHDGLKLTAKDVERGSHLATIGIYLGTARVGEVHVGIGLVDRILALLNGELPPRTKDAVDEWCRLTKGDSDGD